MMNRASLGAIVDEKQRESAERVRSLIGQSLCDPALFRGELTRIPPLARDTWVDLALGLDALPEDGPQLPLGCVPYLPCSVDALLHLVEQTPVRAADLFVDIGAGVGRAVALVHLLTGARAIGVEVQAALVSEARELAARLRLPQVSFVEADACLPADALAAGTVFFLYCPFSGERLARVLASLEAVARSRPIHVCCVALPLPPCPWLEQTAQPSLDLAIYRSRRSASPEP